MKPSQFFRAGVGAVIFDSRGRVLALKRSDIPGSWQLPQGGLEAGEEPPDAVLREIAEETSINSADLDRIEACDEPLAYELPPEARSEKTGRGQVQYWFLFRFTGDDRDINLSGSDEFRVWRWTPFGRLVDQVVGFRAPVYRQLMLRFEKHLPSAIR